MRKHNRITAAVRKAKGFVPGSALCLGQCEESMVSVQRGFIYNKQNVLVMQTVGQHYNSVCFFPSVLSININLSGNSAIWVNVCEICLWYLKKKIF